MTHSILVTGSNRGIGLELVRQYAADGWRVFACCRQPKKADALQQLATQNPAISIHALDVGRPEQIQALAETLRQQPIDILFNNAGIYGPGRVGFGDTDLHAWLNIFHINCISQMQMMEAFVDHVAASELKTIAGMTSKMGSMADNGSGSSYLYRSSKAALNAVLKSAAIDLRPRGIKVAVLHPGWVRTDMGGPNAEITVEQCVSQLRRNLQQLSADTSGEFLDIDGSIIPW